MTRARRAPVHDPAADPFREHTTDVLREDIPLLGGLFRFETSSPLLMNLVRAAYANLPAHRLTKSVPHFRIRLEMSATGKAKHARGEPPPMTMLSGAGFLCGTSASSSFVTVSADERSALVVVSPEMAQSAYHTRYELIEFAVYMLASRSQGLVSLHAGCVGLGGRGVLLIGPSGSGKTTAALHCLLAGFDFVSEDSVLVAPETLRVTGVANFIHLRRDGVPLLEDKSLASRVLRSPVIRRRSGVRKFEVDLRKLRLSLAQTPLKIEAVVFANGVNAETGVSLLRPLRKAELFSRLGATQAYAANSAGWVSFAKNIAGVPAFELQRGQHPRETVVALRTLLERS